jgi:ABC-type sulfate transport system permease component
MKDIISFLSLLAVFLIGSSILHWLVNLFGLSGLAAFLIYCIPMLSLITYTTMDEGENFCKAWLRNAFWGYSFILGVALVAWVIGLP